MSWTQLLAAYDLLDDSSASGHAVKKFLEKAGADNVHVQSVTGEKGATDFVRVLIPGTRGKTRGGNAPTLGIIGRLGGLGARPEQIGFVSDGDGALTVIAAAAKLLDMAGKGDTLEGDVIISTHVDPDAPTRPHDPVPFMDSAVDMGVANDHEVLPEMDAILSVDTTKGNRICNHKGFAITATIKDGWILRVAEPLLDIVERTSGLAPVVLPITMQDITPYGNDVYHVNSIVQPCTGTDAPVVGVAITTVSAVAGSATGATDLQSVESAMRFVIETAKDYTRGICSFYDEDDFSRLQEQYGSMSKLRGQTAILQLQP
jgi:ethanolamine utilization protein EutP (predicted NTPase)